MRDTPVNKDDSPGEKTVCKKIFNTGWNSNSWSHKFCNKISKILGFLKR